MQTNTQAAFAYRAASVHRSQRSQEADVFRRATGALKAGQSAGPLVKVRALADNRRLWTAVQDLMKDPGSTMPEALRAQILSVSLAVQREMDRDKPDVEFLITINEHFAAGLSD